MHISSTVSQRLVLLLCLLVRFLTLICYFDILFRSPTLTRIITPLFLQRLHWVVCLCAFFHVIIQSFYANGVFFMLLVSPLSYKETNIIPFHKSICMHLFIVLVVICTFLIGQMNGRILLKNSIMVIIVIMIIFCILLKNFASFYFILFYIFLWVQTKYFYHFLNNIILKITTCVHKYVYIIAPVPFTVRWPSNNNRFEKLVLVLNPSSSFITFFSCKIQKWSQKIIDGQGYIKIWW